MLKSLSFLSLIIYSSCSPAQTCFYVPKDSTGKYHLLFENAGSAGMSIFFDSSQEIERDPTMKSVYGNRMPAGWGVDNHEVISDSTAQELTCDCINLIEYSKMNKDLPYSFTFIVFEHYQWHKFELAGRGIEE